MQTEIIWKTTLKNGIFGSLIPPLADPFNPDHFKKPIQLSEDEQSLFLSNDHNLWKFSLQEERITDTTVISGGEKLIYFFEKQQFLLCVEADSDYKKLVGRSLQQ